MRTFGHRGRTPHGVRELKHDAKTPRDIIRYCRTPHGVRELKLTIRSQSKRQSRRTPHGVRELKHDPLSLDNQEPKVAPHTGCVN